MGQTKQTPEHVAKRVATLRARGTYEKNGARLAALNISRAGIPLSESTRAKQSASMMGKQNSLGVVRDESFRRKLSDYWLANPEKHNHYVDGKSLERLSARRAAMATIEYRLWRQAVLRRDNWRCLDCGKSGGALHAHHIKPYASFPDLRYAVDNGQALCRACHIKIHAKNP